MYGAPSTPWNFKHLRCYKLANYVSGRARAYKTCSDEVMLKIYMKYRFYGVWSVQAQQDIRRCNKLANYTSGKLRAAKLICLGASPCQGLISIHPPSCLPLSPCSPPFLHLHLCLHLRTKENICRLATIANNIMSLLGAELCVWGVKKLTGTNYDIR